MARILNVELPSEKSINFSLISIHGIGKSLAKTICINSNIDPTKKTKDLTNDELNNLRKEISNYITEGDLRREVKYNIKRLIEIRSYRGLRHKQKLPSRGQSSKQNARTVKGPKKTVANKKKVTK